MRLAVRRMVMSRITRLLSVRKQLLMRYQIETDSHNQVKIECLLVSIEEVLDSLVDISLDDCMFKIYHEVIGYKPEGEIEYLKNN